MAGPREARAPSGVRASVSSHFIQIRVGSQETPCERRPVRPLEKIGIAALVVLLAANIAWMIYARRTSDSGVPAPLTTAQIRARQEARAAQTLEWHSRPTAALESNKATRVVSGHRRLPRRS